VNLHTIVSDVLLLVLSGVLVWQVRATSAAHARRHLVEDQLAAMPRTAAELRAAAVVAEKLEWSETAGRFQTAVADAKQRIDEAEMPVECVYLAAEDCFDEPTSMHVDERGHVAGLCDRHAARWKRLDEGGRRKVRTGGGA
jgi:hypothetical protein